MTDTLWFATGVQWAKADCSIFPAQTTQGIVKHQKTSPVQMELLHPPIFQFLLYRQQSQPKQSKKEAASAVALGELCESVEKKAGCVRLSVSVHAWMNEWVQRLRIYMRRNEACRTRAEVWLFFHQGALKFQVQGMHRPFQQRI